MKKLYQIPKESACSSAMLSGCRHRLLAVFSLVKASAKPVIGHCVVMKSLAFAMLFGKSGFHYCAVAVTDNLLILIISAFQIIKTA